MNNKSLIPISAFVTFGVMTLSDIQQHNRLPNSHEWLGLVVAFTIISLGADLGAGPVAGGFAVLVMLTMALARGPEALAFLTGKLNASKSGSKGKSKGRKGTSVGPESDSELASDPVEREQRIQRT